ncbi:hypothetical protein BC829DRAFT_298134 [Chytridium lagenaria]|nr:hypothetical protein BC829DRAFT_298134 [Chytridium lagenaria]
MSSLSSPQFQDHHPSLLRRASRLSLTETVSSMRTSSDVYISMRPGGSSGQRVVESSAMKPVTSLKQQEQSTVKHQQNKVEDCKKATPLFASSSLYDNDVHVVTGVVKWFLRDGLPPIGEPVCTHELYEGFVAAARKYFIFADSKLATYLFLFLFC